MGDEDLIKKAKEIEFWPFPKDTIEERDKIKYEQLADKVSGFVWPLDEDGLRSDDIRFKAVKLGATKIVDYRKMNEIIPYGHHYMYEGIPIKPS